MRNGTSSAAAVRANPGVIIPALEYSGRPRLFLEIERPGEGAQLFIDRVRLALRQDYQASVLIHSDIAILFCALAAQRQGFGSSAPAQRIAGGLGQVRIDRSAGHLFARGFAYSIFLPLSLN